MDDREAEKGRCARNQLLIWDRLLELRIQLQKLLTDANILPQSDVHKLLETDVDDSDRNRVVIALAESKNSLQSLLISLLQLQESLTDQNPEVSKSAQKSALTKEGRSSDEIDGDEEIPSDEEINSDEELGFKEGDTEFSKDLIEDDDQDESGSDISDGDSEVAMTPAKKSLAKKRKIENPVSEIEVRLAKFAKYRNDTIQKWNDKTQLGSGKRNFSAFQTSTLSQIDQILKDRTRLIKRTQLKRSEYQIIGKTCLQDSNEKPLEEGRKQENDYDEEIFDDDDFYHQLLRELIDRKTANITDPIELSQRWLQIQKLRNKMKKKVDTRASKGRKVRYDVMPKLVNFMAPYDNCTMSDHAVKELLSSLFGQRNFES